MQGKRWIKTSATASGGNSGGGVFDEFGRLVGITSGRRSDEGGTITYARQIEDAALDIELGLARARATPVSTTTMAATTTTAVATTTTALTTTTARSVAVAGTYTVALGDTLEGIARAFNTTVDALRAVNGTAVDRLVDHQVLLLPAGSRPLTAADVATYEYRVVAGDTIIDVANRLGVTPAELFTINGKLEARDRLAVGESLLVPQFG